MAERVEPQPATDTNATSRASGDVSIYGDRALRLEWFSPRREMVLYEPDVSIE